MDLDGASAIYAVHGWPYPYDEDPIFETGLRNTLDFLEAADVKATLFVIAEDLDNPRKRSLLELAVAQGHEIGCHSYTHRKLAALAEEAGRAIIAIEDATERGAQAHLPGRSFRRL